MVACTSKKNSYTQEQLYEQTSSGVVLIQNTYYYKITLSNNGFYSTNYVFSKLQDGELKNISYTISNNFNEVNDTIKSTAFGTGFIISPRGTIVTNSHVINPTINKALIYQALIRYLKKQIDYCNQQLEETRNHLEIFEREIRDNKRLDSQGYAMMMEGIQSSRKWIDTKALLNYGFNNYKKYSIIDGSEKMNVPIDKAEKEIVELKYDDSVDLLLSENEKANLKIENELPQNVTAPINYGDSVGVGKIYTGNTLLKTVKIISAENIEKIGVEYNIKKLINQWLKLVG